MPLPFESYRGRFEKEHRVAYLIASFITGDISEEEEQELEEWILQSDANMQLFEELTDERVLRDTLQWYHSIDVQAAWSKMEAHIKASKRRKIIRFLSYGVAAAVLIVIGTGVFFLSQPSKSPTLTQSPITKTDIDPGTTQATLQLADGSRIPMTETLDSVVSKELRIEKGQVKYGASEAGPVFHELSVPRKGFYQLELPDGSRVWLNAASWIRYPTAFTGEKREVEVKGEVFIEVAKDAKHPFIVSVGDMTITALGTAFNINAYYQGKAVQTTLQEGKIQIAKGQNLALLQPGQQLEATEKDWKVREVDPDIFTAWTKNEFRFKNNTIEEVMEQMKRWYDIQPVYQSRVTEHFTGTISRAVPISELLKKLEMTNEVHFRIKGDTIEVYR